MKKSIDRIVFAFNDDAILPKMEERFIPFSQFLQRLLLETYQGKRMENIIVYFRTAKDYADGKIKKNSMHYHRGHLTYHGEIDLDSFNRLSPKAQVRLIWDKACEYIVRAAEESNNLPLADSCRIAHAKGLEMDINPDFRTFAVPVELYGEALTACVWMRYNDAEMLVSAVFTLEKGEQVLLEQHILTVDVKYEFLPGWFKKIEVKNGNMIIVKGHYDLDCLPMKIHISEEVVKGNKPG